MLLAEFEGLVWGFPFLLRFPLLLSLKSSRISSLPVSHSAVLVGRSPPRSHSSQLFKQPCTLLSNNYPSSQHFKHGGTRLLQSLIHYAKVRINPYSMGLFHVPLWASLVYLRVQILQVEDLSTLYEQSLEQDVISFVC
ncbi:uncharacterized protein PAC_01991 [Phialocephala subalpina]|uniref:Uncharacterized protein n=1 Tax=Phialocephala subalpina TaxID=576137 RepID=A0A1L7WH59_9HELO|nr:uncharacterized protein PAC_01991 [Phialocephala subalpina]